MSFLVEGKNVWKIAGSHRVAFIVDGAAYFDAFIRAAERAQSSILIVSWDIDSQTNLCPDSEREQRLIDQLNEWVGAKPDLEAYILNWDYAPIYTFEREQVPKLRFKRHDRVHFALDARHPYCASRHQKLVVIDDELAFCGGLDLTTHRWDTPSHRPDDPRRIANGRPYPPFHDLQVAVDGEAARALGQLARDRWYRATGHPIAPSPRNESDPWPNLPIDLFEVRVGIARTEPACGGSLEIREVEALFLDSIRSAKEMIYVETQYLSSKVISDAFADRLQEEHGPEIVVVTPRECSGWKEKQTIGVITARLVRDLREKDRHGRLEVLSPRVSDIDVFVHSKLMIVDDRLVRVGSANLSNRSMGVDSECDILIDCDEGCASPLTGTDASRLTGVDASRLTGIRSFRNRLLAEHLGRTEEEVGRAVEREGSLIRAIESLHGGERDLVPIQLENAGEPLLIPAEIADPTEPIDPEALVQAVVPREQRRAARRRVTRLAIGLALLLSLALAWRFTPLTRLIDLDLLVGHGAQAAKSPLAPVIVVLVYSIGTALLVPVNLLLVATGMIFGPALGALYAILGSLAGAASGYAIGRRFGADAVDAIISRKTSANPKASEPVSGKVHRVASILQRRGLVAFTTVRLLPIASFGLVNMIGGAMRIRFHQFLIGTLIGMAPGIAITVLFGGKLADFIVNPDRRNLWALFGIGIAGLVLISVLLRFVGREVRKRMPGGDPSSQVPLVAKGRYNASLGDR